MESQIKKYGRTIKAIEETIKICKGKNILKEFLIQHENEVKTMFDTLFDQKEITKRYKAEIYNEGEKKGKLSQALDTCVTAIKKGLGLDLIKELVNLPEKDFEKIYPKALKLAA